MAGELRFAKDDDPELLVSAIQRAINIVHRESLHIDFEENGDPRRRLSALKSVIGFLSNLDEPTRVHTHPGLKVQIGLLEPTAPYVMDQALILLRTLPQIRWISEITVHAWNTRPGTFATAMWLMESAPCAPVKRLTLFLSPGESLDFDQLATHLSIGSAKELELEIQKDDENHSREAMNYDSDSWTPKLHQLSLGVKSLRVGRGIPVGLEIFGQTSTDGNTTERPFLETLTMDYTKCVWNALSSGRLELKSVSEPDSWNYNLNLGQESVWMAAAAAAKATPKLKSMILSSDNPEIPHFCFTCETDEGLAKPRARIYWCESMGVDNTWKPTHKVLSAWHEVAREKDCSELGVGVLDERTRICTGGTFPTANGEPSSFDFDTLGMAPPERQSQSSSSRLKRWKQWLS
ncbi:hypothetical protein PGQ11_013235 [Apiospora arundinis]|uniref:Uncharacterized protein n=1 Tax=Apiospora arundinis TaxID=335852 RepID=A0ABR2I4M5_9PEZI